MSSRSISPSPVTCCYVSYSEADHLIIAAIITVIITVIMLNNQFKAPYLTVPIVYLPK